MFQVTLQRKGKIKRNFQKHHPENGVVEEKEKEKKIVIKNKKKNKMKNL